MTQSQAVIETTSKLGGLNNLKNFNMKYYKVTVKETLARTVTVKAESEDDAHEKVERMYYDETQCRSQAAHPDFFPGIRGNVSRPRARKSHFPSQG